MYAKQDNRMSLILVSFVLAVMFSTISPILAADSIKGDIELLQLIANGYRENMEKIETWQGKATIRIIRETSGPEPEKIERLATSEFVHHAGLGATRWSWLQTKDKTPYFTSGMIKEQNIYRFGPVPDMIDRSQSVLHIRPKPKDPTDVKIWDEEFNPMYSFLAVQGNIYNRLIWYYEHANDPKLIPGKIEQIDNVIIFEVGDATSINRFEFDTSKGCNLVSYLAEDSITKGKWQFEWEKVADTFVPRKVEYVQTHKMDSPVVENSKVEFVKNIVNQPVSVSEFDIDKLGLRPGDQVVDNIVGIKFKYKELESPFADLRHNEGGLETPLKNSSKEHGGQDKVKIVSKPENVVGVTEKEKNLVSSFGSKYFGYVLVIIPGVLIILLAMWLIFKKKKTDKL